MDKVATEEMAARASPLNPMVLTCSRSFNEAILLVACLRMASGSCSCGMPMPLSSMVIRRMPPAISLTVISVAPASNALSINSLTTEDGRSTTSPAAIWLMSSSGSSKIGVRFV